MLFGTLFKMTFRKFILKKNKQKIPLMTKKIIKIIRQGVDPFYHIKNSISHNETFLTSIYLLACWVFSDAFLSSVHKYHGDH